MSNTDRTGTDWVVSNMDHTGTDWVLSNLDTGR